MVLQQQSGNAELTTE